MYNNIGEKIKGLAVFVFVLGAIVSFGFALSNIDETDGFSLLLGFLGAFLAWLSSLGLYGFGEIIEKLTDIERNTRGTNTFTEQPTYPNNIQPANTNYVQPKTKGYTPSFNTNFAQPVTPNYSKPVTANNAQQSDI